MSRKEIPLQNKIADSLILDNIDEIIKCDGRKGQLN